MLICRLSVKDGTNLLLAVLLQQSHVVHPASEGIIDKTFVYREAHSIITHSFDPGKHLLISPTATEEGTMRITAEVVLGDLSAGYVDLW
jgi:hypothetical protein